MDDKYPNGVKKDILEFFTNRPICIEQAESMDRVKEAIRVCADILLVECPNDSMTLTAINKLEEASMWAGKSIVFNKQ